MITIPIIHCKARSNFSMPKRITLKFFLKKKIKGIFFSPKGINTECSIFYRKSTRPPPPLYNEAVSSYFLNPSQAASDLSRARILKHLLEAEKSTFRKELSFQRSESTTGLLQATVCGSKRDKRYHSTGLLSDK